MAGAVIKQTTVSVLVMPLVVESMMTCWRNGEDTEKLICRIVLWVAKASKIFKSVAKCTVGLSVEQCYVWVHTRNPQFYLYVGNFGLG